MPSIANILVVDDEPQIRKLLQVALEAHQYTISLAKTGQEALFVTSTDRPDLVILDLGLPDMSGTDVLVQIREWSEVPVIVLTAKEREVDKIAALDAGADDYVTKPFGMGELLARVRVALRHAQKVEQQEPILHFGTLMINLAMRLVELNGDRVKLTPTEYDLLRVLATHAGKVVTQKQLLKEVWGGHHTEADRHYLRIYIGHLRKKLSKDTSQSEFIETEPGVGYRFKVEG